LAGFFLVSFFRSMPLLIETSPHRLRCPIGYTPWEVLSRVRARWSRTRPFSDFAREFCHPLERRFTLKPTVRCMNFPAMMVWVTCPVPFKVAIAGRALTESAPGFSPP